MKEFNFRKIITNKKFILGAALYLVPIFVYLAFRMYYYGHLFPNTFFAKTGFGSFYFERGLTYIENSFTSYLYYGVMLFIPVFVLRKINLEPIISLFYLIIIPYLFYVFIVGGDVLPLHRFVLPILPLIYILFSKSLEQLVCRIKSKRHKYFLSVVSGIIIFLISYSVYQSELPIINKFRGFETGLVKKMKIYSGWVNEQIEKRDGLVTVSLSTIGAFSYYTNAEVIDIIGLTDEYIAHNPKEVEGIAENVNVLWKERRYNVDYILERKPDYIIMPAGARPSAYPECALFVKPAFIKFYYPQLIYSNQLMQYLPVYTKRKVINNDFCSKFNSDYEVKYVNNYIQAQTAFLKYLQTGNEKFISEIENYCKNVVRYCSDYESYALSLLGQTYFHAGRIEEAIYNLERSLTLDEYNCFAAVYLYNIYNRSGDGELMMKYQRLIKKYSPDALPNLISEF